MKRQKILMLMLVASMTASTIPVSASEFALSATKLTVNVGDTYDLDVSGTEKAPKWASWDINRVRVNQDGIVTAVRPGKATVSARVGLTTKKCNVTVKEASIKLNKSNVTLYSGGNTKTVKLKCTTKGATKNVTWVSENPDIATVSDNGVITPVGPGVTNIVATANSRKTSCKVTVKSTDIKLSDQAVAISTRGAGKTVKLTPTITGNSKKVKWETSDKTIATVKNGKVTGKKAGVVTITATANGVSTTCQVTVNEGAIALAEQELMLYVGESKQVKSNALATDTVTWTSSNTEVATVESGNITAVGAGDAVITIAANGHEDSCYVSVKEPSISIGEDNIEVKNKGISKTYKLGFEVNGRSKKVKWSSADTAIASVKNGKVTGKKAGTTTITAEANGVTDTVTVTVHEFQPSIKLDYDEYTLFTKKGNIVKLKATVDGSSKKVTWSTSNPDVADVKNGKVVGINEGQAIITAVANNASTECIVTVIDSKVVLDTENVFMKVGESTDLPVDVIGNAATVKYKSSDPKIVSVDNGILTANEYGNAQIQVTANNSTAVCNVNVTDCTHEFDTGTIVQQPTCSDTGLINYACSKCDYNYTSSVNTTDHTWKETYRLDAACKSSGIVKFECEVCGKSLHEILSPTNHSFGEWVVVTNPTLFSEGIEKQVCAVCGVETTRAIPMLEEDSVHEHNHTSTVVAPTCTEKGYTEFKCDCGDTYKTDEVEALGHVWGEWSVIKAATDTEEGLKERKCSRCESTETETIPITVHTHEHKEVVTENATCTESGYTIKVCSCGDTYVDNKVPALGHDWSSWRVTKEATENEAGEESRDCSRCQEIEVRDYFGEAHVHSFSSEVTRATCTERGYTTHACVCGETYTDTYVDASGHSWSEWSTVTEATETAEGKEVRECSKCNEISEQVIPKKAHEHKYTSSIVEPTCTEEGYTEYTCPCGATRKDDYVNPLKHSWGDWSTTKGATETEEGEQSRSCSRCSEVDKQILPTLVHKHMFSTTKVEPTCLDSGYEINTCACGETYKDKYKDALGHNREVCEVIQDATCETDGLAKVKCSRNGCNDEPREVVLPALGHNYSDEYTVDKEPTCVEEGSKSKHCMNAGCDNKIDSENIPKVEHTWGEWVIDEEPTCEEYGCRYRVCTVSGCLEEETESIDKVPHDWSRYNYNWDDFSSCRGEVHCTGCSEYAWETASITDGITKEPTCQETGIRTYAAKFTSGTYNYETQYKEETLPVVDCDYVDGECKWCGSAQVCTEFTVTKENRHLVGYTGLNVENLEIPATFTHEGTRYQVVAIGDNAFDAESPYSPKVQLKSVVIPSTVKSIGTKAFANGATLTSVSIPEGVETIGDYAFVSCENLSTIAIPNSVNDLGVGAFSGCENLSSVVLPDNLGEISDSLFWRSYKLENITIPDTVTHIGDNAFYYSSLTELDLPNNLVSIGKGAFTYCAFSELEIPSSVNQIGSSAFEHTPITSVELPYGIASISDALFSNCKSLVSVNLPETVTSIGGGAFYSCESLVNVNIPSGVTNIGDTAFEGCRKLSDITVPEGVTVINNYTFSGCSSLTNITLPDDIQKIGYGAFSNCGALTSIVLPENLTEIKDNAFRSCRGLTSVNIPFKVTALGKETFSECSALQHIVLPEGLKEIKEGTFNYCRQLDTVSIPLSITDIGKSAFNGCTSLSTVEYLGTRAQWLDVEIGDNNEPLLNVRDQQGKPTKFVLTSSNRDMVGYTDDTIDLVIPETFVGPNGINYKVVEISSNAFSNCTNLVTVDIPDSVITITGDSFYGCSNLTTVTLGKNLQSITSEVFDECDSITTVYYTGSEDDWDSININSWGNSAITGANITFNYIRITSNAVDFTITSSNRSKIGYTGSSGESLVIPAYFTEDGVNYKVTAIDDYAFSNCYNLSSITIPNTVTTIGNDAFYNCSLATVIDVPDSVTSIGDGAFNRCESVVHINIPDSVIRIEGGTFAGCKSLVTVRMPDSLNYIGSSAFAGCTNLEAVDIPSGITRIDESTFSSCKALTSVVVPDNVTSIGYMAFDGCNSLTEIVIPTSLQYVSDEAFNKCALETIYYKGTPEQWSSISVSEEGNGRLNYATKVYNYVVELESNIPTEGGLYDDNWDLVVDWNTAGLDMSGCNSNAHIFEEYSTATRVVIPQGVTTIGYCVFDYSNIEVIVFPDTVTRLQSATFSYCSKLKSIYIPSSVTYIEGYMVSYAPALSNIYFGCDESNSHNWSSDWKEGMSHSVICSWNKTLADFAEAISN